MRFQVWDWNTNECLMQFPEERFALLYVRGLLDGQPPERADSIGLVDKGAPGEVLTYPLEGAALVAKVAGLEASE